LAQKHFAYTHNIPYVMLCYVMLCSNLVHSFLLEKPSGSHNNFPQKGRGLGHVTYQFFGTQSNIPSKLLELETLNLLHSFVSLKPSGPACAHIIFPKGGVA